MQPTGFFAPKRNLSYERHLFRKMKQEKTERIDMFAMKLRTQAYRYEFESNMDDNIKDQITSGWLGLITWNLAVSEQQKEFAEASKENGKEKTESTEVCKIEIRKKFGNRNYNKIFNAASECARCGLTGHKSSDEKCPAVGKTCNKWGKTNHFARKCHTRSFQDANVRSDKNSTEPAAKSWRENQPVQSIEPIAATDDYEDVICDITPGKTNTIWIETKAVVDSGSKYNIMDRDTWAELKSKGVQTTSQHRIRWTHAEISGNVHCNNPGRKQAIDREVLCRRRVWQVPFGIWISHGIERSEDWLRHQQHKRSPRR